MTHLKLSQKIHRYIALAFIATLCICVLILIPLQKKKATVLNQNISALMQTFLTNDMGPLSNAIFEKRTRAIHIRLEKIMEIKGMENAFVFDGTQTLLAGTESSASTPLLPHFEVARRNQKDSWTTNDHLWYLKSIHSFEELIGFILVEYSLADMKKAENLSITLYVGIISFLMFVLLLISHHLIRKIILRPVDELIGNMAKIEKGRYGSQIHTISTDEIGDLAVRFNAMSKEIAGSYRKIEDQNRELQQTKNLLDNIINSMPSILITVDQDLRIQEWNRSASRYLGIPLSQARGKLLPAVLPMIAPQKQVLIQALEHREIQKLSKVSVMSDSKQVLLDITVYPIDADPVKRGVIIIDDITDIVRMETMMIQTEKMMSIGGLAAGMAHEINNPLAGMIQNAQVIQNRMTQKLPANRKAADQLGIPLDTIHAYMEKRKIPDLLTAMRKSGERAALIVRNMLSFSRQGTGQFKNENLCALLDIAIDLAENDYNLKKQFDFRRIEIHREYETAMPEVECEGNTLQQVFFNILKNGAEAMGHQISCSHQTEADFLKTPQFIIRVRNQNDMAVVEIKDNGPGMNPETQKRIFEPFYTTKEIGLGTGLGMSVSYFIITKNHNGELSVVSTPGAGTTFTIKLPYHHQGGTTT